MARIKYDPAATPLTKKHFGYTFLSSSIGKSMAPGQRNNRTRYPNQSLRQQNIQKCVRQWRNMDPATVANWNAFAAAYQQPTKRNPAIFLSGYQLFLKRNSYCFLNHGIASDFMETPTMEELAAPAPTFELKSGSNVVDVTELYIHNFGILPAPGDWLLFWAVPYSDTSGQFFTPIRSILECEEVFVDGLFLNLVIPDGNQNITYSLYLSKPVHAGSSYGGTKIRYMGCFTTKSFLGLTDTPGSYTGQAGKQVSVKADETGLEFAAGGGGGLTCETLAACPTIISIDSQVNATSIALVNLLGTSMPAIKHGLLYNGYCINDNRKLTSSDAWSVPTFAQYYELQEYLVKTLAGGKCKTAGLEFWNTPNTGATNEAKMNVKGNGYRTNIGGFTAKLTTCDFSLNQFANPDVHYRLRIVYNSAAFAYFANESSKVGQSIFLVKTVNPVANGISGFYTGNDGKVYRTIGIGNQEFTADPLAETCWRDKTLISEVTYYIDWANLTTAALCAFDNNWSNVLI